MGAIEDRIGAGPLPNVWLGVSVEDQASADERVPFLLQTQAAKRIVSTESLIGPVDLSIFMYRGVIEAQPGDSDYDALEWLIVGGESGPQARPCDVTWVRALVAQAKAASVPCFVKQLGAYPRVEPGGWLRHWEWGEEIGQPDSEKRFTADGDYWRVHLKDRKGGDPSEWPRGLRVREWPESTA